MDVLKISYDGLETYQKQLFLDIACFWRFTCLSDVMKILDACGYHPEIGIKVLRQKTLLYVVVNSNYGDRFDMHDMVQEMAHYIVRGEHPNDPEKHSRVWKLEEIKQLCFRGGAIMDNNTTEAIFYNFNYSLPTCKLVSNMKKLRWLIMSTKDEDEGPSFLSNELRYIRWDNCSARSPFPYGFLPVKLVVLKLSNSMLNELWRGDQYLPHLKVLELVCWEKLLNIPDFNGLPRLQRLKLVRCKELEEIHESLGNLTSLESLKVTHCWKLKRLPTISRMKNMKALIIEECYLKDGEIPCGIDELSNLQELNLSGNSFSLLDFTISQLTQLKSLNLSFCDKLLELPELPSSLVNLQAHGCKSLTIVEDFYKHYKELCQVSLEDYWWREGLLESMLKGKADDNGCMYLSLEGLGIPKRFRPPPLRGKKCSRLELQENWCNDFSGFLLCFVFSDGVYPNRDDTRISIKQVRGIDSEDDLVWEDHDPWDRYHGMDFKDGVVWEESDGSDHGGMTWVWYVSFGSLRHTAWWDPTYKALAFKINDFMQFSGFGVRLVEKKSTSGLTETSTDSSSYKHTPRIEIQEDSASQLGVSLLPRGVRYRYGITKQPEID